MRYALANRLSLIAFPANEISRNRSVRDRLEKISQSGKAREAFSALKPFVGNLVKYRETTPAI